MSEKAPGFEKYTPTCLDWLTLMLNANFRSEGPCAVYYHPGTDGKTINVVVRHNPYVDKNLINVKIDIAKRAISYYAKIYGWDSWVKIEIDIEELDGKE